MLNMAIDAANNRRKMGVEITEANKDDNKISELTPTQAWTDLTDGQRTALWTHTVDLPDKDGTTITWHVARSNTLLPTYFLRPADEKLKMMRWGDVLLTEDTGDFEWIITHPSEPQGVTYYQTRLAEVNQSRVAVREALAALNIGNELVLSVNTNPTELGQAFALKLVEGIKAASCQITIESISPAITKKALLEGLSQGMNRGMVTDRTRLVDVDQTVADTVATVAKRVAVDGVNTELITAYIMGDLCHKIATLKTGAEWGEDLAADYKNWRVLFPKSHPSQLLYQAITGTRTQEIIAAVRKAFQTQRGNILAAVLGLFASKLSTRSINVVWYSHNYDGKDPENVMLEAVHGGVVQGGLPVLQQRLNNFINANHENFLIDEFDNVLNALTDFASPPTHVNVVRSTGFASHAASNRGFAFEDRGEVATEFPALATAYDRIKTIANRY